ncbi:MAG: hypothetical protein JNL96_07250 [Planctomycetaceae bacterium]|nr:hypothetical protein [Planctomycetaceae bacterium]
MPQPDRPSEESRAWLAAWLAATLSGAVIFLPQEVFHGPLVCLFPALVWPSKKRLGLGLLYGFVLSLVIYDFFANDGSYQVVRRHPVGGPLFEYFAPSTNPRTTLEPEWRLLAVSCLTWTTTMYAVWLELSPVRKTLSIWLRTLALATTATIVCLALLWCFVPGGPLVRPIGPQEQDAAARRLAVAIPIFALTPYALVGHTIGRLATRATQAHD